MAMVARIMFLLILLSVVELGLFEDGAAYKHGHSVDKLGQVKYEGKGISASGQVPSSRSPSSSSSSSQVYYESAGSPRSSPSSFGEAGYAASSGGFSDGYDPSYKPPPPAARARHHVPVSGSNPASDNKQANRKPPATHGN